MSSRLPGMMCIAAIIVIDQVSKAIALGSQTFRGSIDVLPILNIVLVRNDGISFGLLGGVVPWWLLAMLGIAVVAGLLVWIWRAPSIMLQFALGLIIGGAIGNILDRLRFGAVTDFLDFHVAGYHWPAFNFADAAIVFGVSLLLLDSFKSKQPIGRQTVE